MKKGDWQYTCDQLQAMFFEQSMKQLIMKP